VTGGLPLNAAFTFLGAEVCLSSSRQQNADNVLTQHTNNSNAVLCECFYYIRLEANVCCVYTCTRMPLSNAEPNVEDQLLIFFTSNNSSVFFWGGLGLLGAWHNYNGKPSLLKHLMIFAWLLCVESMAIVQGKVPVQTIWIVSILVYFVLIVLCKQVNPDLLDMYVGGPNAMMFACLFSTLWLPYIQNHTFSSAMTIGWYDAVAYCVNAIGWHDAVVYCVHEIHTYLQFHMKDQVLMKKWIQTTIVLALVVVVVFMVGGFLVLYQNYLKIQDDKTIDEKNSIINEKNSTIDEKNSIIEDGKKNVEEKSAEIAQLLSTMKNLSETLQAQAPAALPLAI